MTEIVETEIVNFLNNTAHMVFTSEGHLQICLAAHFATHLPKINGLENVEVLPEYYVPISVFEKTSVVYPGNRILSGYPWTGRKERMFVDIVVKKGEEYLPIELKYTTEEIFDPNHRVMGEEGIYDRICSKDVAITETFYNCWKDVKRLELLKTRFSSNVIHGIFLIVSNREKYIKGVTNRAKCKPFALSQCKTSEDLVWPADYTNIDNRPSLHIANLPAIDSAWVEIPGSRINPLVANNPFHYKMIII